MTTGVEMTRINGVLTCLVAMALVAGCGAQSLTRDSAEPEPAVEATEAAQSTPSEDSTEESARRGAVEEAGAGETQSEANWFGSVHDPLFLAHVQPGDSDGIGNLCDWKGIRTRLRDFTRFGVPGRATEVWMYDNTGKNMYTLICSAPAAGIWGLTTGPGSGGLSVPCPEWAPRVDQRTGTEYMERTDNREPGTHWVSKSSGGYGSNGDGLWNYTYHNWSTTELRPTIWALCR